jgi:hypothetical protein
VNHSHYLPLWRAAFACFVDHHAKVGEYLELLQDGLAEAPKCLALLTLAAAAQRFLDKSSPAMACPTRAILARGFKACNALRAVIVDIPDTQRVKWAHRALADRWLRVVGEERLPHLLLEALPGRATEQFATTIIRLLFLQRRAGADSFAPLLEMCARQHRAYLVSKLAYVCRGRTQEVHMRLLEIRVLRQEPALRNRTEAVQHARALIQDDRVRGSPMLSGLCYNELALACMRVPEELPFAHGHAFAATSNRPRDLLPWITLLRCSLHPKSVHAERAALALINGFLLFRGAFAEFSDEFNSLLRALTPPDGIGQPSRTPLDVVEERAARSVDGDEDTEGSRDRIASSLTVLRSFARSRSDEERLRVICEAVPRLSRSLAPHPHRPDPASSAGCASALMRARHQRNPVLYHLQLEQDYHPLQLLCEEGWRCIPAAMLQYDHRSFYATSVDAFEKLRCHAFAGVLSAGTGSEGQVTLSGLPPLPVVVRPHSRSPQDGTSDVVAIAIGRRLVSTFVPPTEIAPEEDPLFTDGDGGEGGGEGDTQLFAWVL